METMLTQEYREQVKQLLVDFLYFNDDPQALLSGLQAVERHIVGSDPDNSKQVWLRFYKGDPLATTLQEMKQDLAAPFHKNYAYLLERLQASLERDELEVYYS
jgi:hypothetical protein